MASEEPSADAVGTEPPSDRACSTCFEPIHPSALKCKTCGSYQDFRRHLQMGSTVLALLVALISVVALAAPIIKEAVSPRDSRLEIFFQGLSQNKAYFMVTNRGDRPGSITSAALTTRRGSQRARVEIPFTPQIVAAGGASQLIVALDGAPRRMIDRRGVRKFGDPAEQPFVFEVEFRNFASRQPTVSTFRVDLKAALGSGGTDWHRCAAHAVDFAERTPNWRMVFSSVENEIGTCPGAPNYMPARGP